MIDSTEKETGIKIFLTMTKLFINYIKYIFLTWSVVFAFSMILFIIISINPNFSFGFFGYLSFINPIYENTEFSMGPKETVELFSILSLIIMVVSYLIKIILKKLFKINIIISLKSRIIFFFIIVTSIYGIASIIVMFSENLSKWGYLVFLIFYLINLFFMAGYFTIDTMLNKISQSQSNPKAQP
jgi:hypothetical protein